jgi:hypothetical protein
VTASFTTCGKWPSCPLPGRSRVFCSLAARNVGPKPSEWLVLVPWLPSITFFLLGLGVWGAIGFMLSVLPVPTGNALMLTDGHQLMRIWREVPGLARWRPVRAIGHLAMAGVRAPLDGLGVSGRRNSRRAAAFSVTLPPEGQLPIGGRALREREPRFR